MKKIITSLLIMIFLLGMATIAYAGTTAGNTITDKKALLEQKIAARQQRVADRQAFKDEIQPMITEIKANRTKIQQLRSEARDAHTNAMQHMKDLKAKSDQLSDAQIAELKQVKDALKQTKLDLADTKGDIQTEIQTIKEARQEQNADQAKESLNKIIAIQQNRMELIQNSIDEMNQILEI